MTLLKQVRASAVAAYVAPFMVFMVLLEIIRRFRIENELLPWWRQFPEQWGYPLQTLICLGLLWFWRHHYPKFSWRGVGLGILMGVVGIVIWLAPTFIHAWTGCGDQLSWLKWLGFRDRLEGFNPNVFDAKEQALAHWAAIVFRFLRLVVIVALVEEIFWRGFLMRYLIQGEKHWLDERIGTYRLMAFWVTTLLFASAHMGPDFAVAIIYGALAGWVTIKTGNLWAVVIMHAVANLCLGFVIMVTRFWGLW